MKIVFQIFYKKKQQNTDATDIHVGLSGTKCVGHLI